MRSTWDLLSLGWQRLKSDPSLWLKLIGFQIMMTVVVLTGMLLVLLAAATVIVVVIKASLVLKILGSLFAAAIAVAVIVAAIYFLGGAYLSLIVATLDPKRRSVTEYYREGRAAVSRLVTAQLWLLLWIVLICSIPLALFLAGLGSDSSGLTLVALLIFFALLLGVSIVAVRFSLLPFIVVGESLGGRAAVSRAWKMTDTHWWKSLLVVGATQLFGLLLGFLDGLGTRDGGPWSDLWTVIYVLATLALTVWTLLVLREYYRDLSGR